MARTLTQSNRKRPSKAAGRRPRSARSTRSSSRATRGDRPTRDEASPPHRREVQAFLERFSVCLTHGDGDGVVHCFELPALMVMGDPGQGPSQVLQDPQKVAGFFAQAPEAYQAKGIETTYPELERLDWVDDAMALATVRFPYIDAEGNDLGDGERSIYVLRRDGNGELAICAAIALGTDSDRAARRRRPRGDVGDHLA